MKKTIGTLILLVASTNASAGILAAVAGASMISHMVKIGEQNVQVQQAKTIGNGGENKNCKENFPLGAPIVTIDKDKVERRSFYLCRSEYAVQFDPAKKTPIWSAENLDANRLENKVEERTEDFRQDPEVPSPAQAQLKDYQRSHFDRGHMSPAGDMSSTDDSKSYQAMSESFFLTNMVPQVGANNNRGIWKDIESKTRKWAMKRGQVYVVSGPIYEESYYSIGGSKVAVPNKLFKVLIDAKTYETVGFIVPNQQVVTKKTKVLDEGNEDYPQTLPKYAFNCGSYCEIQDFEVPVAQIEKVTGLRFFSELDQESHDKVVNNNDFRGWK